MTMRHLILVGVFLLASAPGTAAFAVGLDQVDDTKLVHLLNDAQIIAEHKKPPIAVRIFRLRNHGECDGAPETCPKETLYIAVSTFDEAPDERVYVLPEGYGWTFVRWKAIPKDEGSSQHVVIEVTEKIPSSTPAKGWWLEKRYELGVNPWDGYLREIGMPAKPQ